MKKDSPLRTFLLHGRPRVNAHCVSKKRCQARVVGIMECSHVGILLVMKPHTYIRARRRLLKPARDGIVRGNEGLYLSTVDGSAVDERRQFSVQSVPLSVD